MEDMERNEFRERMNQFKKAREANPQLSYWEWKSSLPENLAHTPDWQYNNIGAWAGGLQPKMYKDGYYHLDSRNPYTGEILKPKSHPTYQEAIEKDIAAGYFPYEKNGVTYTKTYAPIGDLSGYADGTDGIEIPKTGQSDFIDNWNKARLDTGRFDDQLGNGEIDIQKANRDANQVYTNPRIYGSATANKMLKNRFGTDKDAIIRNIPFARTTANILRKKTEEPNVKGMYFDEAQTIYIDPEYYSKEPTAFTHESAHASRPYKQEAKIAEITGGSNDNSPYLFTPREIYARLMQLRNHYNIDPNKVWNEKDLKQLKKSANRTGKNYDIIDILDDDTTLRLFNEVAYNQPKSQNQFDLQSQLYDNIKYAAKGGIIGYSDGTDGIKMTPEQEKKFLEDRQKYAQMSGAISPVLDIRTAADFTPIGNAIASKEIYDATSSGNYLDAGIIGASLVVPPVLAKPVKRYIPTVTRSVEDKINALLNKDKIFKETEWNNTINRAIERIYDKDVRDRAAQIKSKYGVDIQSQYDAIDDLYTNNYESIPKAKIMSIDDGARAKIHTNPTASKAWATEGKPAGMKDFEMQVRPDVEPSKEIAEHEINHWWTYSMMQNPDWRRSELQKITKDFEGALHKINPLDPDNSEYYRDWMEQNAYGINVVNSMKELGIPFTKENVIKFINWKPDTSAQKRAARQFKNMDLYYDWLRTMPLAGMAGAAYMLYNEEE